MKDIYQYVPVKKGRRITHHLARVIDPDFPLTDDNMELLPDEYQTERDAVEYAKILNKGKSVYPDAEECAAIAEDSDEERRDELVRESKRTVQNLAAFCQRLHTVVTRLSESLPAGVVFGDENISADEALMTSSTLQTLISQSGDLLQNVGNETATLRQIGREMYAVATPA